MRSMKVIKELDVRKREVQLIPFVTLPNKTLTKQSAAPVK